MADDALASHLVRTNRVCHLMWFAAIHELHKREIVGHAGSICECGIPSFLLEGESG